MIQIHPMQLRVISRFGRLLEAMRLNRSLSQAHLAERAGFDHSYVSRLESGARAPTRETVTAISDAMALSRAGQARLMVAAGFLPDRAASPVIEAVILERARQDEVWGKQEYSWPEWMLILTEEVGEAAQAANKLHWLPGGDADQLREELVQVAAVSCQIIECIDRYGEPDNAA